MSKITKFLTLMQLILCNTFGQSLLQCSAKIQTEQSARDFSSKNYGIHFWYVNN